MAHQEQLRQEAIARMGNELANAQQERNSLEYDLHRMAERLLAIEQGNYQLERANQQPSQ